MFDINFCLCVWVHLHEPMSLLIECCLLLSDHWFGAGKFSHVKGTSNVFSFKEKPDLG